MNWTIEQVLAYAPDTGTADRAKRTAKLNKWTTLAKNDRAIWGTCKGSGSEPYRAGVDLNGVIAFKCSCPVRRLPCKHVVALMLLHVNSFNEFEKGDAPQWMSEWLTKRNQKVEKAISVANETDEELAKKKAASEARFQKRLMRMKNGMADIEIWLMDVVRQGIASVEKKPYSFWNETAARLVDSQAKGAGNFIKEIPLLINMTPTWYETVLSRLGDVYLIAQAFKKIEELPEAVQSDVLSVAGYSLRKGDLLTLEGVSDHWEVLGKVQGVGTDESIIFRRIWLKGQQTNQYALILDFIHVSMQFDSHWLIGSAVESELVYYPSNYPVRSRVKRQIPNSSFITEFKDSPDFDHFLNKMTQGIAANPWLMDFPCMLDEVTPVIRDGRLILIDRNQIIIPVVEREMIDWKLLSLSGGNPIAVFGEWTGSALMPLSAMVDGRFIDMSVS